jgi:hypothetical protein
MGLSAPLALLGLALVALPIAAHLLRRADVKVRTLPTVELLRRAAVESHRRVRVVDPWLLAARIAMVGIAALALAGPFALVELSYGDGRIASVAIVIDDSMSMEVVEGGASRFDLALRRAQEIAAALPAGSELAIVRGGAPPRVALSRGTDVSAAGAVLASASSPAGSARGSDLPAAVELAARQLAGARHDLRRIVVLSDFAGPADGAALEAPAGIVLDAERIGGEEAPPNVALTSATVDPDASSLRLEIEARAFGEGAPARVPIDVTWRGTSLGGGELVFERGRARTIVSLELPGTSEELEAEPFVVITATTGDALAADDRRAVLSRPATAPRVVVVDGRPSSLGRRAPGEADGARFVRDALALVPRSGGGPFVTRVVDAAGLLSVPPGSADVLLLAGLDVSSAVLADAIRAHHEGGAGILLTAGPDAPPGTEVRLDDLLPGHGVAIVDGETEGLVREGFTELVPPGPTGLEHVRITRRLGLEAADPSWVALRFSGGAPALILDPERRTALFALPLDASWSDLSYRPGFLPLVSRVVRALARPGAMPDEAMAPGEVPAMAVGGTGSIELALPSGAIVTRSIDGGRVALDDLALAGAYLARLPRPDGTLASSARSAFVIAAPALESDLSPAELPAPPAGEARAETHAIVERPLGRWAFLAVGLLAAVEGLFRLRRARGDTRPETAA